MKKIKFNFGFIFAITAMFIAGCEKDMLNSNDNLDDPELKSGQIVNEAGGAFAYGTHVFTTNPKANPDGLQSLNLTKNRWGWASLIEASEGTTTNPINETYHFYITTQTGVPGIFPATTLVDVVVTADETNLFFTFTPRAGYSFSSTHWDQNYPYTIQIYLNSFKYIIFRPHGSTEAFTREIPLDYIPNYTTGDAILVSILAMIEPLGAGYAYVGATSPVENMGGGVNVLIKPNSLTCLPQVHSISYYMNMGGGSYNVYRIDNAVYVWNDESNFYLYNGAYFSYYTKLGLIISDTYQDWVDANHGALVLELTAQSGIVTVPLSDIPGYVSGAASSIYFNYSERYGSSGTWVREHKLCTLTSTLVTELPIYMGAALNDTKKGTQVGIAYIEYDGHELKVKYDLFDEYVMNEVHIYASDTAPTAIVPGQFGFTETFEIPTNEFETTFNIEDIADDGIWIILHATINF